MPGVTELPLFQRSMALESWSVADAAFQASAAGGFSCMYLQGAIGQKTARMRFSPFVVADVMMLPKTASGYFQRWCCSRRGISFQS